MSRSNKRNSSIGDDQPKFTTPHMLRSRRSESRSRLVRMTNAQPSFRRKSEFTSGKLTVIILAALVVFLMVFMVWMLLHKNAQVVRVDNEDFAYINNTKTTTEEFNSLLVARLNEETGSSVQINETVVLVPVRVSGKKVNSNVENVITTLCSKLTYKQEAAIIMLNDEEKAVLSTKDEAQAVLDEILEASKTNPEDKVEFADKVEIGSRFADAEEVITKEKAKSLLTATTEQTETYTVQSGDSFGLIADKYNMTQTALQQANPTITDVTKLQIGQSINVVEQVPLLKVKVTTITAAQSGESSGEQSQ
jgi:LysM repeat protein